MKAWLLWNALFAFALYVGVWLDVTVIGYGVVAFVWLMLTSYFLVLYTGKPGVQRKNPVPTVAGVAFDVSVLAVLIACNWYWTATAYAVSAMVLELTHRKSEA